MSKPRFRSPLHSGAERLYVVPGSLRDVRERAGFTREQLAVRCGLSSTTLYLAERGGLVSTKTLCKVFDAIASTEGL